MPNEATTQQFQNAVKNNSVADPSVAYAEAVLNGDETVRVQHNGEFITYHIGHEFKRDQ